MRGGGESGGVLWEVVGDGHGSGECEVGEAEGCGAGGGEVVGVS